MTDDTRPDWTGRLNRLQASLPSRHLEAFVVSTPLNVAYLTGFTGSSNLLVVTPDERMLLTDGRYAFAVRAALADGSLAPVLLEQVDRRYDLTLGALVVRRGLRRVGFEPAHVTVSDLHAWQRATPGVEWVPCDRVVEAARAVKDAGEIATFRRAGRALMSVAAELSGIVRGGRTEREVAADIDRALGHAGFQRPAFPTIVASGPNSSHPHARPTDRPLQRGDLVVLDFGGVLDGYCVDLTRMAAVDEIPPAAMALYVSVREALESAVATIRPGIDTSEVDRAARTVLEARGLGEAFLHATGHGLGLEVHESPRIARADPDTSGRVEAGMIFTVEPGAYVEGVGGARLEDDVLVTAGGCEVLTEGPRDLLVV